MAADLRLSLKIKLIILMVAILGATIVGSYRIFERSGEELVQEVIQHIKSLENVGDVVEISRRFTTKDDLQITQKLQMRLKNQPGKIAQVSVLNTSYKVIESSNPQDVGLTLQELKQRRIVDIDRSFWETLLQDHIKTYDITLPILENGQRQGFVHVIFVMNELEYLIKKAKYTNMLWIASIFAAGTLIAILLVNRFTRPIDQLVQASKAVAQGNFDVAVHIHSDDELNTLISGFNEMTVTLKAHKALEESYQRSERMAALGELGARLAHEIRNPLNSISLIIDHLKDRFAPHETAESQKFERYITNIKIELKRLNKLVADFLQVSWPLRPEMHLIQVNPLLKQIQQLLEAEAEKYHIRFELDVMPETVAIQGDEGLLKTAWLNIALNALQAMEQAGGQLRIQASALHDPEMCKIVFADTGPGIPREHQQKIFEPYFTTKKEGTGLGLAIVNRVIEDHHGTIQIESEEGKGTKIILTLPLDNNHHKT